MIRGYRPYRMGYPHTVFDQAARAIAACDAAQAMSGLRRLRRACEWIDLLSISCVALLQTPLWGDLFPRLANRLAVSNVVPDSRSRSRSHTDPLAWRIPAADDRVARPRHKRNADITVRQRVNSEAAKHRPVGSRASSRAGANWEESARRADRSLLDRLAGAIDANESRTPRQQAAPLQLGESVQRRRSLRPADLQQQETWRRSLAVQAEHRLRAGAPSRHGPIQTGATTGMGHDLAGEATERCRTQPPLLEHADLRPGATMEEAWTRSVAGERASPALLLLLTEQGDRRIDQAGTARQDRVDIVARPPSGPTGDRHPAAHLLRDLPIDVSLQVAESSGDEEPIGRRIDRSTLVAPDHGVGTMGTVRRPATRPASSDDWEPSPSSFGPGSLRWQEAEDRAEATRGDDIAWADRATLPAGRAASNGDIASPPASEQSVANLRSQLSQTRHGPPPSRLDPFDDDDLAHLADQMKRILKEEARRHGIDV